MRYGYINENGVLISKEIKEIKDVKVIEKTDEITGKKSAKSVEAITTVEEQIEDLTAKGWKPVDEFDITKAQDCGENETVNVNPFDAGNRISYTYEKVIDTISVQRKIDDLKQQLADSDYKVIKNYESSMAGVEIPCEIKSLHEGRQALRDSINRLKSLL